MKIDDETIDAIRAEFDRIDQIRRKSASEIKVIFERDPDWRGKPCPTVKAVDASKPHHGAYYTVSKLPGYDAMTVDPDDNDHLLRAIRNARDGDVVRLTGGPSSRQWG